MMIQIFLARTVQVGSSVPVLSLRPPGICVARKGLRLGTVDLTILEFRRLK